jgi:anti-sigma-K factor RskA
VRRFSADAAHALAAEYVLGTLRGRARHRFEALARDDRELAGVVRRWEAELTPLAERIAPVEPPARVWREIESRITPSSSRVSRLASDSLWRGLALISGGLASVLLIAFLWISGAPRDDPLFVAVLTGPDAAPRMVVSMHEPDLVRVRMVKPWKGTEGKSLELWVLPASGPPRSLGLVPNARGDTLIRVATTDARVQGVNALAISLEPMGGSPSGLPTGPVLCSGVVAPVKKA